MNKIAAKTSKILMAVIISVIAISLTVGLIPLDIKKQSTNLFKKAAIDQVEIKKAVFKFPNHLKFKDIKLTNKISKTNQFSFTIKNLHTEIRPFYAFKNRKNIESLIENKFNWKYSKHKDYHLPFLYSLIDDEDTLLINTFKNLTLKNSTFTINSSRVPIIRLSDFDGQLKINKDNTPNFSLNLKAKAAKIYEIDINNIKGKLSLKDSLLTVYELTGGISKGNFQLKSTCLDMKRNIIKSGNFNIKEVDINHIIKPKSGDLSGFISLNAQFDTSSISLTSLKGSGNLSIKNLQVSNIPLLRKAVKLTDLESLKNVQFKTAESNFEISKNKIYSDTIEAEGKNFSLYGSGYIKLTNQYFQYKIKGIFEKHMRDSMTTLVWDALLPMKDGRKYFKCTITGTPDNPSINLEHEMIRSAAKSIFKSIKKDFKSLFK